MSYATIDDEQTIGAAKKLLHGLILKGLLSQDLNGQGYDFNF